MHERSEASAGGNNTVSCSPYQAYSALGLRAQTSQAQAQEQLAKMDLLSQDPQSHTHAGHKITKCCLVMEQSC